MSPTEEVYSDEAIRIQNLKSVFHSLDSNKDGFITTGELKEAIYMLIVPEKNSSSNTTSDDTINYLIAFLEDQGIKSLSFDHFRKLMDKCPNDDDEMLLSSF